MVITRHRRHRRCHVTSRPPAQVRTRACVARPVTVNVTNNNIINITITTPQQQYNNNNNVQQLDPL